MKTSQRRQQAGVALLLVILALLVVTAVAAGMMIYSTSETRVDANYRDEQVALFAAKAGLEEARNRMLTSSSTSIATSLPCVMPGGGTANGCTAPTTNPTAQEFYIVANSGVKPWASGNYLGNVALFDSEFECELGSCTGTSIPTYNSTTSGTTYSGPTANQIPYQWVRINLKLNNTQDSAAGGTYTVTTGGATTGQVMFDSNTGTECVYANCPAGDSTYLQPVYEVTSYAVTPSGTVRMMQDDVAAYTFNLNLKAAVTLPGTVGAFSGGSSANYSIDGTDGQGSAPAVAGCTPNSSGGPAVAVSSQTNANVVTPGMKRPKNYTGPAVSCTYTSTGCIGQPSLPTNLSTPAEMDQTLASVEANSNACLGCTATTAGGTFSYSQIVSALPGGTWPTASDNPQIVYVDGNLDISASSGSGILVVTGNLTFDGNSNWNGIILVVGEGTTTFNVNGGGNGQFDGEMLVATTKDSMGNTLSSFGTSAFNVNGGGGSGVYYNSCWVNAVEKPTNYDVLSSKEISQ